MQIAKHIGAYIITTVSANDMDYVKKLGADVVIDYKTQKFEDLVKNYDAVFDTVGGETTNRSLSVLKNGGILVSMIQLADQERAKEKHIRMVAQQSQVSTDRLNRLSELVDTRVVTVHVEKTFPLEKTAEALEYLKNTPPQGKVVVVVR